MSRTRASAASTYRSTAPSKRVALSSVQPASAFALACQFYGFDSYLSADLSGTNLTFQALRFVLAEGPAQRLLV